jgi:hypothetical protein
VEAMESRVGAPNAKNYGLKKNTKNIHTLGEASGWRSKREKNTGAQ